MRIAFVHHPWDYPNPSVREGSLPIWVYEMARRLARCCDVTVFGRAHPTLPRCEERDGVRFRGVSINHDRPLLRLVRLLAPKGNPRRPDFASLLYHLCYAVKVAIAIRRERCDLVHINNFSNFVPIIRRLNPHAKIALHMECEWLTQLDPALIEPRLRQVNGVIGCSEYVTNKVRRSFPQLADRCHVVLNGVDVERFARNGDGQAASGRNGKQILFVGRVSPEKGVHRLIDAFEQVLRHHPDCSLKIVGPLAAAPREFLAQLCEPEVAAALAPCYDYDYVADLRDRAARLGPDRVDLVGPKRHQELPALFAQADLLVNPSYSEAFGMTVVEAMASGTPVVATRVGGMMEILEGEQAGLLVEPGNAAAVAEAIVRLIDDDELRRRMGVAGRRMAAERYSWDRLAETLLETYRSLM